MDKIIISFFAGAIIIGIACAIPTLRQKYMHGVLAVSASEVILVACGYIGLIAFCISECFYYIKTKKAIKEPEKTKEDQVPQYVTDGAISSILFLVYLVVINLEYEDKNYAVLSAFITFAGFVAILILHRWLCKTFNVFNIVPKSNSAVENEVINFDKTSHTTTTEKTTTIPDIILPFLDVSLRAPLTEKEKEIISSDLPLIQSMMKKPEQQKEVDNYLAIKLPKRVFSLNKIINNLEVTEEIEPTEDELSALRYSYLYNATYPLYVADKDLQGLAKNTLLAAHHSSAETRKRAYDELITILTENKIFDRSVEQIMNNIKGKESFYIEKFKSFDESDSSILEIFTGALPQLCFSANIKDDYLIDAFTEALKRLDIDLDTYESPDLDVVEF